MRRLLRSRFVPPVLIALGAFFIVAALLVRFYAYPSLARVPNNFESMTELTGSGVTVFDTDPKVLAPVTTDVDVTSHTIAGDYPDAPAGVVVWANSTTVKRADGVVVQQSTELAPFDAVTGEASDYGVGFSSASQGDRTSVTRTGQVYKFPFNTQRTDYQQWDADLGTATTATYTGTSSIQGLRVYTFEQVIAPTAIGTQEVPGSLFGSDKPSVKATMMYAMDRTLSIEPATGSPVDRVEKRDQYLTYRGVDVPVFVGTIGYAPATVDQIVGDLKSQAPLLSAARLVLPVGFGVLGALLLLGGVLLGGRRHHEHVVEREQELLEV